MSSEDVNTNNIELISLLNLFVKRKLAILECVIELIKLLNRVWKLIDYVHFRQHTLLHGIVFFMRELTSHIGPSQDYFACRKSQSQY